MRKSSRVPSERMMYRAPGSSSGPLSTSSCSRSMLKGVTTSGNVRLRAMVRGTPTSSMARFGSPVMTVRAEKSTRFPIRLPRTRPSLPLSRCEMDLSGRPERVVAGCTPGSVFVTRVARWYCRRETCCSTMWFGAPFRSCSFSDRFVRTMSISLTVRSSSPRPPAPSIWMEGRTCGGGTGSTVITIQSGRAFSGSKPRRRASTSEMPLRILCARSAVSSSFFSWSSVASLNSARIISPSFLKVGWGVEQDQQTDLDFAMSITARSRRSGFLTRVAREMRSASPESWPVAGSGGSSPRITEQEKQTQRSVFIVFSRKETWYIGFASSMWPKWPGHSLWSMPQVAQFM
mmetsp:Transcript_48347/g.161225  ORF Transcript_48347/g.161225 Transcript_48347/m.161225 type:complete len:346 (+) Transcript_48347:3334-4371(+)